MQQEYSIVIKKWSLYFDDARPFVFDDDTFAVCERCNGLIDAAHDREALVFYSHSPGKQIPALKFYACRGKNRDPQGLHEQTNGCEAMQRIPFTDAGSFFGVIALMEGAVLFKVLDHRVH